MSAAQPSTLAAVIRELSEGVLLTAARVIADDPADVKATKRFRIALRRLRSALRPLRAMYGDKAVREVGDRLRLIAGQTGRAREEQALRETLAKLELAPSTREALAAWQRRRLRHERSLGRGVVRFVGHSLAAPAQRQPEAAPDHERGQLAHALVQLEQVLQRGPRKKAPSLGALSQQAIAKAKDQVRAHAAASPSSVVALHDLRIRFKRLRFAAELLARVDARPRPLEKLAERAAVPQKRLGWVHDLDEAMVRMRRARGLEEPARSEVLAALAAAREQAVAEARAAVDHEIASWSKL